MSKQKPLATGESFPREELTGLIRDLAVKPPVKDIANVKAATDAFEANESGSSRQADDAEPDSRLADAPQRG